MKALKRLFWYLAMEEARKQNASLQYRFFRYKIYKLNSEK